METHIEADELVRGLSFANGRGCFIGCTFDRYDHEYAALSTGVPEWLWYLADGLHESMSRAVDRGDMALKLLHGFEKCEDFDALERAIHIYIQRRNIERVTALEIDAALKSEVLAAIDAVISCHEAALPVDAPEWAAARSAAALAARSAQVSVTSEAGSAEWSAALAARYAAKSAAWSAAAWSTRSAALAARSAAEAEDWSALAGWSAKWSATYDDIGQELLRLLGVYGLALSEAVEAGE